MSRSRKENDLRRLSVLQERVQRLENQTDDPHARQELRRLKSSMTSVRADVSHMHGRIEDIEAELADIRERMKT